MPTSLDLATNILVVLFPKDGLNHGINICHPMVPYILRKMLMRKLTRIILMRKKQPITIKQPRKFWEIRRFGKNQKGIGPIQGRINKGFKRKPKSK